MPLRSRLPSASRLPHGATQRSRHGPLRRLTDRFGHGGIEAAFQRAAAKPDGFVNTVIEPDFHVSLQAPLGAFRFLAMRGQACRVSSPIGSFASTSARNAIASRWSSVSPPSCPLNGQTRSRLGPA